VPALKEIFLEHLGSLRRYARALVGSHHESDDLVQECLVRALSSNQDGEQLRNPRAYLFSILHNAFVDGLRNGGPARRTVGLDQCRAVRANAPAQPGRLDLMDLERALRRLPSDQRAVVLLVGLEGMPYGEVAQILDIPVGTVMSRLSRGRAALKRMIEC